MTLQNNINQTKQLIEQAEHESGREPGSVLLLAVSKQQSINVIHEAFNLGLRHFGENYYQEALEKIEVLNHLPIDWHFIGPIQSNKTKGIARHFNWVHSINRVKIAEMLHEHRPKHLPPLNVCMQINLVDEPNKSGVSKKDAMELARTISQFPYLALRGLMTIPPPQQNPQAQYCLLSELNELLHDLNQELGLRMDTLSMGMTDDLLPAIKAGATIVRVGRALFGERRT